DTSGTGGELRAGEVYSPVPGGGSSQSGTPGTCKGGPSLRQPLASKEYIVQETPFSANLQQMLSEHYQRPPTYHHSACRMLVVQFIQHMILPFVLVCIVGIGVLRHLHLLDSVGSGGWWEGLVTLPIAVTLPLLPLVFPSTWLLLMAYGNARISALLQTDTHYAAKIINSSDNIIRTTLENSKKTSEDPDADPFDETEIDRSTLTVLDLAELKHHFVTSCWDRNNLTRSSNTACIGIYH
ncbi:transmembrane protein 94-like, partial [Nilaparvata lugens]|uniref:transmembrane protein 94-like n=1 Tax=Nilaparvata lugens TaxID=108931 RepID=UPI00193EA0A5